MSEHADLIEFVNSIFDTVDAKDWDAAENLFGAAVDADFTSLNGGVPVTITNVQLVDGWRQGLHPGKKSFHMVGRHRLRVEGETATVGVKGYAYNVLDEDVGGGMWEVWGHTTSPCAAPAPAGRRPGWPSTPGTAAATSPCARTCSHHEQPGPVRRATPRSGAPVA